MHDGNIWHTVIQEKSTQTIYRKYKHSIKDEQNLYDNSGGTEVPPHYLKQEQKPYN